MTPQDVSHVALRDSLVGRELHGSGGATYILRKCIGEGGQGWVFTANYDSADGVVVIVKVLRPTHLSDEGAKRFEREASVLRMLSQQATPNPYIVRFFDHATALVPAPAGGTCSLPFTVLEYVDGITLAQAIDARPGEGMHAERARRILRQMAHALDHVHAHKLIHRDLKPSNVLLAVEAGGEVAKITDFGLVKLVELASGRTTNLAGASVGYAPAEQYEHGNERVGPRTDVFSLAAVAFEMLTATMAFPFSEGENPLLCVTRMLNGPRPTLLSAFDSLCPELRARPQSVTELDAALTRALSASPAERFASAGELVGELAGPLRAATEALPTISRSPASLALAETSPMSQNTARSLTTARRDAVAHIGRANARTAPMAAVAEPAVAVPATGPGLGSGEHRLSAEAAPTEQWRWSLSTPSIRAGVVTGATFFDAGETIVAAGPTGLARWNRGAWTAAAQPSALTPEHVRGVTALPSGELLLFGARGLAMIVSATGAHRQLHAPDPEAIFHGAHVDSDETFTLVGEHPARGQFDRTAHSDAAAIVAEYSKLALARVLGAPPVSRLHAATRTVSGQLIACGDRGALVGVDSGGANYLGALCLGDLNAIVATSDGGATTVGSGGHALQLSADLRPRLEAVQTARDLLCLCVSSAGRLWTGSRQTRILRRSGDAWLRMSGELPVTGDIVALHAGTRTVRAVCSDGAVVEGVLQ